MDDDLEVGIAAGLDVPTAIEISEDEKRPQGCLAVILFVAMAWLLW